VCRVSHSYHYTLGMLADRGFESDFWFSTRLRSFTLYLENDSQRYRARLFKHCSW
jgi:hypothetical protein